MKKLILSLIFMSSLYSADWYIVGMNTKPMQCIKEPNANPYKSKQAGMPVKQLAEGMFRITVGDMSMFVANSKKNCQKIISIIDK